MQNRCLVWVGPSGKTCPRWDLQFLHMTSILFMPWDESSFRIMFFTFDGLSKEGQPVPESNLASEAKRTCPHAAHT